MYWTRSLKTPTPEVIERALARLGKPGANAYFFDKLANPAWVTPLYERGFFKRPPPPDRSRNDGTVSFPDWPELRYLHRMVTLAPEVVGNIAVLIPNTENSRVRELQVQIGRHLNCDHSCKLTERAVDWLDDGIMLRHFGEPFAQFIVHLTDLGELKHAIRLAKRLFASEERNGAPVRAQLDEWHYERYLKLCLPAMREHAGLETLALFRDLLLDATREPQSGQLDDYSYIWRRDLLRSNHTVKQIPDILIDALRDTALELSQRAGVGFHAVRKTLVVRNRLILTRVVVFVAAQVCDPNDSFVLETLLDTRLLDRLTCRGEYTLLLHAVYPKLPGPAQEQMLAAMSANPLQTIPPERQQELGAEQCAHLIDVVMRNRLSAFGDTLPPQLLPRRTQLIAEHGEIQTSASTAVWHGPTSPVSADALGAMSVAELEGYLRTWVPTQGFGAPSREGVARDLQQLAKNRAADWSKDARNFIGLNPTYVRGIILGLNDACTAKVSIDWPAVLGLLRWVMNQPRAIITDHNAFDEGEDPDWSWTRQTIARLLTSALTTPEAGLEWSAREAIWPVIHELLQDPDPPIDADPFEDRDPLTASINSVRGVAAHALFRFAWWISNHQPPPPGVTLSFERMPEVKIGVERVLADPSPAVRSVLGDWLRTLFYFDPAWTVAHIDTIFLETPELNPYWLATWRAFAEYDQPYDPAFSMLLRKYAFAVGRLPDFPEEERKKMGETGLGQHLASYYWRGIGGEETRELLLRYFDFCTPTAAAHVLWSLGRGLDGPEPISPQTIAALARLWSDLHIQSSRWGELKRSEVYRQFGSWFMSGRFDEQWALRELKHAMEFGAGILDVEGVLARLATLCVDHPRQVADILEPLLKDDRQLWQPLLWQTQVEAVLRALLNSPDAVARSHAAGIADQSVQNGGLFARDLLSNTAAT
jgi:hypothetical protein